MKRARVFIVDDAPFIRKAMARVLSADPEIEIVGEASNGMEALETIGAARPDVVTLDVNMPGIDGLTTLRELRKRYPQVAVVMLSSLTQDGASTTLQALHDGAVDFIDKNEINVMDFHRLKREVLPKLKVWVSGKTPPSAPVEQSFPESHPVDWSHYQLCVIGASTGGPPAIEALMRSIPADFPAPIIIVQHMPTGFTRHFAERLDGMSRLDIAEAYHGARIDAGRVWVAPAGKHLRVDRYRVAHLSDEPSSTPHRPSVDVTMYSAARTRPRGTVAGVLLTGMGEDGAQGMCSIRQYGGLTIGENETSCVVSGMPKAAYLRGGVELYLPLPEIVGLFATQPVATPA